MSDFQINPLITVLGVFLAALGTYHAAVLSCEFVRWCIEQVSDALEPVPHVIARIVDALHGLRRRMADVQVSLASLGDELAAWWRFFRGT
jgi:hypothetical protein